MKYIDFFTEEGALQVTSDNDIFNININEPHPEMIMQDNSMVIFPSSEAYYKIISNAELFTQIDQDLNLELLLNDYIENVDTVTDFSYHNDDVIIIASIVYEEFTLYYLQRTGINPLSE